MARYKFYDFNPIKIMINLITVSHFGIYYYIILLSQLIILTPIMYKLKGRKTWLLVTPITILCIYGLKNIGIDIKFPYNVLFFGNGFTFFYLGMFYEELKNLFKDKLWFMLGLGLIANIIETIYLFPKDWNMSISQFKMSSLYLTFILVLIIMKYKQKKNVEKVMENRLLVVLGNYSFGIYLIHMFVIIVLENKYTRSYISNDYIRFFLVTILDLLICCFTIFLSRKILKGNSQKIGL